MEEDPLLLGQLAQLGDREEDERAEQADAPLGARQRHRVEDPLQRGERRDEEREHERRADQLDEPPVLDRVAAEDGLRRLACLEGRGDVHQGERRQAHRRRDHEVVVPLLPPGDHCERERGHQHARRDEPGAERAIDDRRARVAGGAPHQPGHGRVEAQSDRE